MSNPHTKPTTFAAVGVLALVGWLALNAVACQRGESAGEGGDAKAEAVQKSGEDGAGSDRQGASSQKLPGEREPGDLKPKRVGPESPALFVTSGLKGYLEPCGCTADILLGGAERIVGYVEAARTLYSDALMIDSGDLFFEFADLKKHQIPQERAKAKVVAKMQRELKTRWTVPGERDFALGVDFYRKMVEKAGIEPLGANVELDGEGLKAATSAEAGDWTVGVIGAAESALYEDIEGVKVSEASAAVGEALEETAIEQADARVLLLHGRLKLAKELLAAHETLDFVVVGHGPREPGQADVAGSGHTLEVFDQGRYVGILQLYGREAAEATGNEFVNASTGGEKAVEEVDEQIEHVKESLERVEKAAEGKEEPPPILERLRERLEDLEARKKEMVGGEVEIPEQKAAFVWRTVAMEPGYPIDEGIRRERKAFNARLKELNQQVDREIPPVPKGEATYIGNNQCATCHAEAHDFWKGTDHAKAVETLRERDKLYDQSCVGCHVVGYEKPGGSVLGKLQYEAEVDGHTLTKDLRDVGCETCHGPGSKHRSAPLGADGKPQHILVDPAEEACMECHVKEHSPGFEFESYVEKITGEGHERGQ